MRHHKKISWNEAWLRADAMLEEFERERLASVRASLLTLGPSTPAHRQAAWNEYVKRTTPLSVAYMNAIRSASAAYLRAVEPIEAKLLESYK
jgi:hypothetical protein